MVNQMEMLNWRVTTQPMKAQSRRGRSRPSKILAREPQGPVEMEVEALRSKDPTKAYKILD